MQRRQDPKVLPASLQKKGVGFQSHKEMYQGPSVLDQQEAVPARTTSLLKGNQASYLPTRHERPYRVGGHEESPLQRSHTRRYSRTLGCQGMHQKEALHILKADWSSPKGEHKKNANLLLSSRERLCRREGQGGIGTTKIPLGPSGSLSPEKENP